MPAEPTRDNRSPFATRLDDWLQATRAKQHIKRGKTPGVIPYIGYGSTTWIRVLGRVLYLSPLIDESNDESTVEDDLNEQRVVPAVEQVLRVRGWRSFTSVPVPHHEVTVHVDGKPITQVTADRGGVIDHVVNVELTPGWHTVTLHVDGRIGSAAPIYILDPMNRFGVISDVDDTILNTALPRPLIAAWNSFVVDEHARTTTPGMPVLYEKIVKSHRGSPVFYLSTGAWNVAPALTRFLERNMFPVGPLLLTDWGPTTDRWFRSGKEHKSRELERLAHDFPEMKWVLFGDDGQHDEMLYQRFALAHPENVAAIAIRQLSTGQAVLAGGRSKAKINEEETGVSWVYGPDGATLYNKLVGLGIFAQ